MKKAKLHPGPNRGVNYRIIAILATHEVPLTYCAHEEELRVEVDGVTLRSEKEVLAFAREFVSS